MISDTDVSDITLTKDFDTATVGGTVSAGTSGIDISNAVVVISDKTNYMDAYMDLMCDDVGISQIEDGTWSTEVILSDSLLNVYVLFLDPETSIPIDAYTLNETYIFDTEGNTDINCVLSDMTKASVELSGTITGLSDDTKYRLYCGPEDMLTIQKIYGLYEGTSSSQAWNLVVPIASVSYDAYFYVILEESNTFYKTQSSYSLGTSNQTGIVLDISTMDEVDMPY